LNLKSMKEQTTLQTDSQDPVPGTSYDDNESQRLRQEEEDGDDGDTSDDGIRSYYPGGEN